MVSMFHAIIVYVVKHICEDFVKEHNFLVRNSVFDLIVIIHWQIYWTFFLKRMVVYESDNVGDMNLDVFMGDNNPCSIVF